MNKLKKKYPANIYIARNLRKSSYVLTYTFHDFMSIKTL